MNANKKQSTTGAAKASRKGPSKRGPATNACAALRRIQNRRKTPRNPANFGQETLRLRGVDVIGTSNITSADKVGKNLLGFVVNPRSLTGTRLSREADLWARWRPRRLRIEVASAAGLMLPGAYIVAWSANPEEQLTGQSTDRVVQLASLGCQLQNPVGATGWLNIPISTTARWYMMSGEAADDSHGKVMAALAGITAVGKDSAFTITWKLHWDIEFNGPDMPIAQEELYIQPEAGWENIFTDGDSAFHDSAKLTFKHAQGGAVVPWQGVRSGVVYTITTGVKIPYYDANGAPRECKWFSRIITAPAFTTALACHASENDAKEYQSNSDVTKVLSYIKAGEWATPSLPRLKGAVLSLAAEVCREPARAGRGSTHQVDQLRSEVERLSLLVEQLISRPPLSTDNGRPETPDSFEDLDVALAPPREPPSE